MLLLHRVAPHRGVIRSGMVWWNGQSLRCWKDATNAVDQSGDSEVFGAWTFESRGLFLFRLFLISDGWMCGVHIVNCFLLCVDESEAACHYLIYVATFHCEETSS